MHNNGTASDTFQLAVNSVTNATCNGCVVAVSESVTRKYLRLCFN